MQGAASDHGTLISSALFPDTRVWQVFFSSTNYLEVSVMMSWYSDGELYLFDKNTVKSFDETMES